MIVNALAMMSFVPPARWLNPVPVTTSTPMLASYVADVTVGAGTVAVMPLPVRSATVTAASAPAAQSSAAARL